MIQEQARTQTSHRLTMQDRAKVELTGVTEVISFDNEEIILETVEGCFVNGDDYWTAPVFWRFTFVWDPPDVPV